MRMPTASDPYPLAGVQLPCLVEGEFLRGERGTDAGADGVDHLLIRRYLALLHKSHKKSSIGRKLAAIRAFARTAERAASASRSAANTAPSSVARAIQSAAIRASFR